MGGHTLHPELTAGISVPVGHGLEMSILTKLLGARC